MSSTDPLSRLVAGLESSLAMYLADSGIASYPGSPEIKRVLAATAADHRDVLARAAEVLAERERPLPRAGYPIAFTAIHDLGLEALLPRIIGSLEGQVRDCESVTAAAADDATARELAAAAAAATRRHVDSLRNLAARLKAGLSGRSA
jgi:hypothetical protein